MSSMATPSQAVLSFDHEVTQWISRVILVRGSALNSDQLHALTGRGPTFSVKVQSAGSIRGVGPAVSTGKLSTRCCPGGIRSDSSDPDWRPVKPRVTMVDFLRVSVWNRSSGAVASGRRPDPRLRTATTPRAAVAALGERQAESGRIGPLAFPGNQEALQPTRHEAEQQGRLVADHLDRMRHTAGKSRVGARPHLDTGIADPRD